MSAKAHLFFNNNLRGSETIKKIALDRSELNESRKKHLDIIKCIHGLASGHPDTNKKNEAKEILQNFQNYKTEYVSMLRSFFRKIQ